MLQLGYLMSRVHQHMRKNAIQQAAAQSFDFRFEQMILLRIIDRMDTQLTQAQLQEYLPFFDRPRMSRTCAEMDNMGLIQRSPNPENRRENLIDITPKGLKAINEFKAIIEAGNPHLFNHCSPEEVDSLLNTLGLILNNLEVNNEDT